MLVYFILGALFTFVCLPVLQSLISIISSWAEYVVYTYALKIANIKNKIQNEIQSTEDQEEDNTIPIGFQNTDCVGYSVDIEQEQEEDD